MPTWFSQTHKMGNIGIIANFVFTEICSFLLYLHYMMLVNVKLDISMDPRGLHLKIMKFIVFVHF